MAAKHKYQNAHMTATTKELAPDRLLELALEVIGQFKDLEVIGQVEDGLSVLVRSWAKVKLMHFVVAVDASDGASTVVSEIVEFRTNQATVFFIPIGPKELLGYKPYKNFMELYAKAITTLDPTAVTSVVEIVPAGAQR